MLKHNGCYYCVRNKIVVDDKILEENLVCLYSNIEALINSFRMTTTLLGPILQMPIVKQKEVKYFAQYTLQTSLKAKKRAGTPMSILSPWRCFPVTWVGSEEITNSAKSHKYTCVSA